MKRLLVFAAAMAACLVTPAIALGDGGLDHSVPFTPAGTPPPTGFMSGGEGAKWELVQTLATGNSQTDLDFFTQGGNVFASVGTLAVGANAGGQTIVQLTQGNEVKPSVIKSHPSASCISNPSAALGLQHDVEATPKGSALLNADVLGANRTDTQLLLDATDAAGRCHDQGIGGLANAPRGGLEIIDVTDIGNPQVIGMTAHIGQAHTVNVDPRRPQIAYVVSSDAVTVDAQGKRLNEDQLDSMGQPNGDRFDLDGWEMVDLSSCMNFPQGTTLEQKRDACRPQVFRYRYESLAIAQGHTNKTGGQGVFGCHELEVYPDDRLTCGGGNAAILFDIKSVFNDNGTPANFSDDKLNGAALPCRVRDSSSTAGFTTGAKVTDCVTQNAMENDTLGIPKWIAQGAPSVAGVKYVGSAFHQGRESAQGAVTPKFDSTQDIDFNHETEFTQSGRFLLSTDERGGGVLPPGASCSPGADVPVGNGGVHAYDVGKLLNRAPTSADDAFTSYARNSQGGKSIIRVPIRTQSQATACTAHVMQQIPGQNRIFMGWYSQGTQVIDYTENANGTLDFKNTGFFIPTQANEWVSHVFKAERNADGSFTYFGAATDFTLGESGRNAIDIYKVTLPPPPAPAGRLQGTGAGLPPTVPTTPQNPNPNSLLKCLSKSVKVSRLGLAGFRIGATRRATLDRTTIRLRQARGQALRYCVVGGRRLDVVFRKNRAIFMATNASRGARGGVKRGDSARKVRRFYGKLRPLGSGVFAAGKAKRVVFGIKRGKVTFTGVVDNSLLKNRRLLKQSVRRAGF